MAAAAVIAVGSLNRAKLNRAVRHGGGYKGAQAADGIYSAGYLSRSYQHVNVCTLNIWLQVNTVLEPKMHGGCRRVHSDPGSIATCSLK